MPSISPPHRHPCGKIIGKKQPTTAAARQTERARREADQQTLLARNQPHRRVFGDNADDPMLASALGRFLRANHVPGAKELHEAADRFQSTREKFVTSYGARIGLRDVHGSGNDISLDIVHKWKAMVDTAEAAMIEGGGKQGAALAKRLIDGDDWPPKEAIAHPATLRATVRALQELAFAMGTLNRDRRAANHARLASERK